MKLQDVEGARTLRIDGSNKGVASSVFITCGRGFCIEVDRAQFVAALVTEFGLAAATAPPLAEAA